MVLSPVFVVVTGLLMNEAVKEYTSASSGNNKFKGKRAGNDSGLESGNSLNTCKYLILLNAFKLPYLLYSTLESTVDKTFLTKHL